MLDQNGVRDGTAAPPGTDRDFEDFYAGHFRSITVQLYTYFGDLATAQDVTQEAFCRALARWRRLKGYDDPGAWVRRVAWNLATSKWRRDRTAARYALAQREEHVPPPSPVRVALMRALSTLPTRHRRAVVLHYVAGLSVREIAEQEGVAPGTVKSWLHRGRTALTAELTERG